MGLEMPDPVHEIPASASKPTSARISVRDEDGNLREQPLIAQATIIGRSESALVRLPCESVSRRHAELFRDAYGRWWLRDLGSVNGTLVNGREIAETVIRPADLIEIGGFELRLVSGESTDSTGAPSTRSDTTSITHCAPLPLGEMRDARISTLGDVSAPKIDTAHLTTISEFASRMSRIQDPQQRLSELCRLMVRRAFQGSSAVAVQLQRGDSDEQPVVLCDPETRSETGEQLPYLSRSLLRVVRQTEAPALAAHGSTDPGAVKMTMISSQEDVCAVACPLRRRGDAIDVLYVTLPASYGTGEWLTLIAHAAQTYEHIENGMEAQRQLEAKAMIERELDRASAIQRALVPRDPVMPGLDLAIGFEPCRWVGGDYVDVVPAAGGRTLLAIADVCGKGMPAAMVSFSVHSMVHALQRAGIELEQMIRSLNDHLCQFLADNSFVTMACLLIDPATGEFHMINAGHPAPVVVAPDGSISELQQGENFPLGIMPFDVTSQRGVLEPGHLLTLFTDGLTEMTDDTGQEIGPERIARHIRDFYLEGGVEGGPPGGDLKQVSIRLAELLNGYLGDRTPGDDRTFLLARRS